VLKHCGHVVGTARIHGQAVGQGRRWEVSFMGAPGSRIRKSISLHGRAPTWLPGPASVYKGHDVDSPAAFSHTLAPISVRECAMATLPDPERTKPRRR